MNEFNIIGKAVSKPELKKAESGNTYAQLVVSVKKPFKNKDGEYDSDDIQLTLFKACAEEANEYVKEGTPLLIKGHINSSNYTKEGKTFYNSSIIADRVSVVNQLY